MRFRMGVSPGDRLKFDEETALEGWTDPRIFAVAAVPMAVPIDMPTLAAPHRSVWCAPVGRLAHPRCASMRCAPPPPAAALEPHDRSQPWFALIAHRQTCRHAPRLLNDPPGFDR
jgi:hypothetical protein